MKGGRTVHDDGAAEIFLHEVLQAMGRNQETAEASKREIGKAPAGEEPMRTPNAAAQRQTTPATARYMGQTQPGERQLHRAETSRAAMEEVDQSDQRRRNTPWGLWSATWKTTKDLQVSQALVTRILHIPFLNPG